MTRDEQFEVIAENVPKVYEAGKKAEYDRFWDVYQNSGDIKQYHYAFAGYGWTDETFIPKHNIIMQGSCLAAFQYCKVTDIAERLKECGVVLDTSKCSNFQGMFAYSTTKSLPVINVLNGAVLSTTFLSCTALERIEKLVVKKSNTYNNSFVGCTALKDIVIDGEIGNDINFQDSPLSKESILSVLGALSRNVTGKTLTLSKAAVESAFEQSNTKVDLTPLESSPYSELSVNDDGTLTLNATPTNDDISWLFKEIVLPRGEYTYRCSPSHIDFDTYGIFVRVSYLLANGRWAFYDMVPNEQNEVRFSITEDEAVVLLHLNIFINFKWSEEPLTLSPVLERVEQGWDSLVATKPNWTISLV